MSFNVGSEHLQRLVTFFADRNTQQKHVWRARIILESGEGSGTMEIMRCTGKLKTCFWRWPRRDMEEGVDGLLHV